MSLYLLDANTLIEAKNQYYPFDRVPEFWGWLLHQGSLNVLKMLTETHDEISNKTTPKDNRDELSLWSVSEKFSHSLLLDEEVDREKVAQIIYGGYESQPTEDDLEKMGKDPYLLAYGLVDTNDRVIVTVERSKPTRKGANKKIPDVAKEFGIRCNSMH